MPTANNTNSPKKYAKGQHPNSKANLKPFTSDGENSAREAGKKGAEVTNNKKHEKKQIREIVKIALGNSIKDLDISKEKKKALVDAVGMKDTVSLSEEVAQTIIQGAIIDRDKYSIDKILDFDGSNDKTMPENVFVANFNVTKSADDIIQRLTQKSKENAQSDNENI